MAEMLPSSLGESPLRALLRIGALLASSCVFALGACDSETVASCDCPPESPLTVKAPATTKLEIVGGSCTGTCQKATAEDCGDLYVWSSIAQTCSIRATSASGEVETLSVTFGSGCCGLYPSPARLEAK